MRWSLWCLAEVLTALPWWACSDFLVVLQDLAVSLNGGWNQRTRSGSSGALKYLKIIDQLRAQTHKCSLHMKLVIIYSRTIVFPKSIPIASVNHAIDRWTLRVIFWGIDSPKPYLCKGREGRNCSWEMRQSQLLAPSGAGTELHQSGCAVWFSQRVQTLMVSF